MLRGSRNHLTSIVSLPIALPGPPLSDPQGSRMGLLSMSLVPAVDGVMVLISPRCWERESREPGAH